MNRIVKVLLGLLLSVVILVIILFKFVPYVLVTFYGKDDLMSNDSDLQLQAVNIPQENNAYYFLKIASEKLNIPAGKKQLFDDMASGKKWDAQFAEELIQNNKEAIDNFDKAAGLSVFQDPIAQDPSRVDSNTVLFSLNNARSLAKLKKIKADYFFSQDKQEEAFNESFNIIDLGQKLENSPRGSLITYLVGLAIKEIGLASLRTLLPKTTLTPAGLKGYSDRLKNFESGKETRDALVNLAKLEYMGQAKTLDNLAAISNSPEMRKELENKGYSIPAEIPPGVPYYFKPNQTKKLIADDFRKIISNISKNCNEDKNIEIEKLASYSIIGMIFTENQIGKLLMHDMAISPSFVNTFAKSCQDDVSVNVVRTLFVLKAYQLENGKLPVSLNELVPKYISALPIDSFSGKPINYSLQDKIIYSVGSDLKDEGGSKGEDWKQMADPTFKIEF